MLICAIEISNIIYCYLLVSLKLLYFHVIFNFCKVAAIVIISFSIRVAMIQDTLVSKSSFLINTGGIEGIKCTFLCVMLFYYILIIIITIFIFIFLQCSNSIAS